MKNVDHDAVSMRSSLEAHSTFTNERNGQLFFEVSLMAVLTLTLTFVFFWGARRGVEGEVKSCRPPSAPRTCLCPH